MADFRTSSERVKEILIEGKQYDSTNTPSVTPFIRPANALVTWLDGKDSDGELSDMLLEEIECFLAAHFYAHADQLLQTKTTADAGGTFQGKTGMGLSSTQYGQTAMVLDVTGKLAQRSQASIDGIARKLTVYWGGRDEDSERPDKLAIDWSNL